MSRGRVCCSDLISRMTTRGSYQGRILLCLGLLLLSPVVFGLEHADLLAFTRSTCNHWSDKMQPSSELGNFSSGNPIRQGDRQIGLRHRLDQPDGYVLLNVYDTPGRPRQFMSVTYNNDDQPTMMVSLGPSCKIRSLRRANLSAVDETGQSRVLSISALDESLRPAGSPEWINPPTLSSTGSHLSGEHDRVRVGMVDSGVNYQLTEIASRLARSEQGEMVGYDFWDLDALPFDANVVGDGFFVQRHGTRTASIVLREAPNVELVPYRYPRPDMDRMIDLVEHAVDNNVSIVGMPLGSQSLDDWKAFQRAAEANPQLLFIVSAGNNGFNIENRPVYPAALDIANILVVTSSDDFVRPAERTNWGRLSVDFLLPAENISALDFSGKEVSVSGSSYAVSRLVALTARLKQANPDWQAKELIRALRNRYTDGVGKRWVYSGYIADPLNLDLAIAFEPVELALQPGMLAATSDPTSGDFAALHLPLDVLVLDTRWTSNRISAVLNSAFSVLQQCGIVLGRVSTQQFNGPDYLRDLSTGTARTLMDATATRHATVVFARDSRMSVPFEGEAFGLGNTRDRPWLRNSVWLTEDISDPGLALAHELFHVLSNNGEHVQDTTNLMSERTRPGQDRLDDRQCMNLREMGKTLSLLVD